ncbi:hypothetical protein K7432_007300 [Basidiobolus ranarum]|uniref:Enoyl reductase (ER) domain-containing protein n=1 Tax=Basidiobolus ranarum TaxID=34480 RepID=A0ABR2WTL8_9FUNG
MARTIRSENPGICLQLLDLEDQCANEEPLVCARYISESFVHMIVQSSNGKGLKSIEEEISIRNSFYFIPRYTVGKEAINFGMGQASTALEDTVAPLYQPNRVLKLEIESIGLLDTLSFQSCPMMDDDIPDDMVDIEVKAVGINSRDVAVCMGIIDENEIGAECAGVVTKIGRGSSNQFHIGQRVFAVEPGCFSTFIRAHKHKVYPMPEDMTFEDAATIMTIYSTAYYSLMHIAQIKPNQTVLIHSASAGFGQAAIQICKWIGCQIYATIDNDEKADFLVLAYGLAKG